MGCRGGSKAEMGSSLVFPDLSEEGTEEVRSERWEGARRPGDTFLGVFCLVGDRPGLAGLFLHADLLNLLSSSSAWCSSAECL